MSARTRGFTLVTCAAALDVPRHNAEFLPGCRPPTCAGSAPRRALAPGPVPPGGGTGAALIPRTRLRALPGPDAGISQATGYRYLHEGIGVPAAQAPDRHAALGLCFAEGMTHLVLYGTHIACDRLSGVRGPGPGARENVNDRWFSQKGEEAPGRGGVPPVLYEDVEQHPVLIDGPPQVLVVTVDLDEDLAKVPPVPRAGAACGTSRRRRPGRTSLTGGGPTRRRRRHRARASTPRPRGS